MWRRNDGESGPRRTSACPYSRVITSLSEAASSVATNMMPAMTKSPFWNEPVTSLNVPWEPAASLSLYAESRKAPPGCKS